MHHTGQVFSHIGTNIIGTITCEPYQQLSVDVVQAVLLQIRHDARSISGRVMHIIPNG